MKQFWETTKNVFAILGLAALVAGLTAVVFLLRRKKDETVDTDFGPVDPMATPGVVAALDAGRERLAAMFERFRLERTRRSGVGGDTKDGGGGG
jgi:LPXTG-motif cell wall-anchored protein